MPEALLPISSLRNLFWQYQAFYDAVADGLLEGRWQLDEGPASGCFSIFISQYSQL